MARPTEYNANTPAQAAFYLERYHEQGDVVPSIEGLAKWLGLSRETIYDWEGQEGKEEFSDIVKVVRSEQARTLINGGLSGNFNAPITKVMLTKHGYRDSQEITGKDGKDLIPEERKEAINNAVEELIP